MLAHSVGLRRTCPPLTSRFCLQEAQAVNKRETQLDSGARRLLSAHSSPSDHQNRLENFKKLGLWGHLERLSHGAHRCPHDGFC